jgi:hypothetical protein
MQLGRGSPPPDFLKKEKKRKLVETWFMKNNILVILTLQFTSMFHSCWDCTYAWYWYLYNAVFGWFWRFAESNIFDSNIMNFYDAARRIPKRRRTSSMKSIMRLPDLNSPPAEGASLGVPSSSSVVSHNNASSSVPPAAVGPQIGIQSAPVDVIVIDDDVMIYPTRSFPQVCLSCRFLISTTTTTKPFSPKQVRVS